jgi:hypothetical protein
MAMDSVSGFSLASPSETDTRPQIHPSHLDYCHYHHLLLLSPGDVCPLSPETSGCKTTQRNGRSKLAPPTRKGQNQCQDNRDETFYPPNVLLLHRARRNLHHAVCGFRLRHPIHDTRILPTSILRRARLASRHLQLTLRRHVRWRPMRPRSQHRLAATIYACRRCCRRKTCPRDALPTYVRRWHSLRHWLVSVWMDFESIHSLVAFGNRLRVYRRGHECDVPAVYQFLDRHLSHLCSQCGVYKYNSSKLYCCWAAISCQSNGKESWCWCVNDHFGQYCLPGVASTFLLYAIRCEDTSEVEVCSGIVQYP